VDRTRQVSRRFARRISARRRVKFHSENGREAAARGGEKYFLDGKISDVCRVLAKKYFLCGRGERDEGSGTRGAGRGERDEGSGERWAGVMNRSAAAERCHREHRVDAGAHWAWLANKDLSRTSLTGGTGGTRATMLSNPLGISVSPRCALCLAALFVGGWRIAPRHRGGSRDFPHSLTPTLSHSLVSSGRVLVPCSAPG
jgi:hypothetical protein